MLPIGESLQSFATRTSRPIATAYAAWHASNNAAAQAWQLPSTAPRGDDYDCPHVTVAGARCLSLLPTDIKQIVHRQNVAGYTGAPLAIVYQEAEKLADERARRAQEQL